VFERSALFGSKFFKKWEFGICSAGEIQNVLIGSDRSRRAGGTEIDSKFGAKSTAPKLERSALQMPVRYR
jgi:hypothetical protein